MADHAHESITIHSTPSEIMAVIADFETYPSWAGPVKRTEVLERDAEGRATQVRLVVELLGLGDSYINAYTWGRETTVSWTMLEGRSQKSQVGSYTLEPIDDRSTSVTYDLVVEVAIPVPGLIRKRIQRKIVDAALADLKKRCES